jgi:hypothetical protein
MEDLSAHANNYHYKSLARAKKGYLNSYQRFVTYNHFNPRFHEKWPRVSLDNLCLHQNVLYSSLLEFLDASDMVKSDDDCYDQDGGIAHLVVTERSLTAWHYASLLRLRSIVLIL